MGKAVEAVGGALVGLVGGGIKFAFGLISGVFGSLLQPEVPDASSLGTGHQDLRTESNSPRLMIVGKAVTSGPIVKYQKRTINKKEYNLFFTPLAAHPCDSVTLYQLDGKSTTALSGNGYRIQVALGDQTTPNSTARSEMTNVDENCVGFGITYAYHKYEVNPDIFPNGVQDVKFLVAGIKCYDPRKDSSVGGDGGHRADEPSTWEWTENPVLINLYWKRFGGDEVLPIEMFDMANLAYEANLCDEVITFEDKDGVTHTEKRWTCNGVIDLSQGQRIVEEELLKSCGSRRWIEAGGKYWLLTAAYRGPATITLTDDDLKADVERQPYTPLEDRCNAVVAKFIDPKSYYQETNCTEIFSEYYRDTRDKKYLQHQRQLGFTNSDTMCQRSNRIYMEQLAAGDTLKVVVGWKGVKCSPGKVVNIEFKEHNIMGKEYEVVDFEFDTDTFTWSLILQETAPEMYDDSVIPAERDLTPNTDIDNTYVTAPQNIHYSPTPNDAWRQGVLTWEHDAPDSIRRYVVLITKQPADSFSQVHYPTQPALDVNNLELGNYSVAVAAQNRFEKNSVATQKSFNVGATSTPTENIGINILPGRVIVNGPTPPNGRATYEWKYSFEGGEQTHFDSAINGGRNLTLTITNTPHNGTVTVWYRLVNDVAADPNWLSVTIPNLIGIDAQEFVPETFALVQWPGLPAALGDHIDAITNDVSYWSTQTSEQGNEYQQLIYNLTEAVSANQINSTKILGLQQKVGNTSVAARFTEFQQVNIGYEDENGDWVVGAPLVRAFEEVKVTNSAGEELTVISFMQALEDQLGQLGGTYYLGVVDENDEFTGLSIQGGNNNSSIHLYMDNLKFASQAGVVFFNLNTITGKLEIGADTEFTGTLSSAREVTIREHFMRIVDYDGFGPDNLVVWKGEPILTAAGEPDYNQLRKSNGKFGWEDIFANQYVGGSLTTGELLNGGDSTLLTVNPTVEVGPFTTNGNPKQISYGISWSGNSNKDGVCPTNDSFTPRCTLILERSINGGPWTQLQSHNVEGEMRYQEFDEPELTDDPSGKVCSIFESTRGSFTYTDSDTSLEDFAYRLRVTNQFRYHVIQYINYQNLNLISAEERPQ